MLCFPDSLVTPSAVRGLGVLSYLVGWEHISDIHILFSKVNTILNKMLKGSTLKVLDVRIIQNIVQSRSAGKYKLHNTKVSATLEFS